MSDSWQASKVKIFLDVVTVASLVFGAAVGFLAWNEYKRSNAVNTESMLLTMDRQLYLKIAEKPYLQALFAHMTSDADVVANSTQLLELFLREEQLSFTWKDIPDLHDKLFQFDGFNQPDRVSLREGFFLAEDILYLLLNCYEAYDSSIESETGFETWIAYIYDIGKHPLFLAAIYCGHKYGYMDADFAAYLAKRMKESKDIENTLKILYPDMLKEDWAGRTGKEWTKNKTNS